METPTYAHVTAINVYLYIVILYIQQACIDGFLLGRLIPVRLGL